MNDLLFEKFITEKSQPVPRPNQFIRATQPTWSANRVTKKYISTTVMTKDLDRVKNLYEMTATLDVPQFRWYFKSKDLKIESWSMHHFYYIKFLNIFLTGYSVFCLATSRSFTGNWSSVSPLDFIRYSKFTHFTYFWHKY